MATKSYKQVQYIDTLRGFTSRFPIVNKGGYKSDDGSIHIFKRDILKIELFDKKFLKKNEIFPVYSVSINDCEGCLIYIVDNIQIEEKIYETLNWYFFKNLREIQDEENFTPYKEKFPEITIEGYKRAIIITL
jgi:hypothetical protein